MSPRIAIVALVALAAACGHTHETKPVAEAKRHPSSAPGDRAVEVPTTIASSPAGLLKAGAAKRIRDKLTDKGLLSGDQWPGGLDGATREALRRFQRESDLPATGIPDDATVRKLGLSPDDVFRRTE